MKNIPKNTLASWFIGASNVGLVLASAYLISKILSATFLGVNMPYFSQNLTDNTPKKTRAKHSIQTMYLFGQTQSTKAAVATPTAPQNPVNISTPPIQLTIVGLISGNKPNRSVVMLKVGTNTTTKIFSVGDKIDANTLLLAINKQSILVDYYGEEKEVFFKSKAQKIVINQIINSERFTDKNTNKLTNRKQQALSNDKERKKETRSKNRARNALNNSLAKTNDPVILPQNLSPKLNNIKKQINNNDIMSLSRLMTFIPVFRDGKTYGIKVSPGTDRTLFKHLKLQRGDIITSINSIPTNDLNRLLELRNLIKSTTVFDITLERKGRMQNLSVILP